MSAWIETLISDTKSFLQHGSRSHMSAWIETFTTDQRNALSFKFVKPAPCILRGNILLRFAGLIFINF